MQKGAELRWGIFSREREADEERRRRQNAGSQVSGGRQTKRQSPGSPAVMNQTFQHPLSLSWCEHENEWTHLPHSIFLSLPSLFQTPHPRAPHLFFFFLNRRPLLLLLHLYLTLSIPLSYQPRSPHKAKLGCWIRVSKQTPAPTFPHTSLT